MFESYGCKVIVFDETKTDEECLAADIMSLLETFSDKFY